MYMRVAGRGKSRRSWELIRAARIILEEIQPATVRAVCYRLFVAGLIDSMDRRNTSRVSVQLTWAREQGIVPWHWIVDDTRHILVRLRRSNQLCANVRCTPHLSAFMAGRRRTRRITASGSVIACRGAPWALSRWVSLRNLRGRAREF